MNRFLFICFSVSVRSAVIERTGGGIQHCKWANNFEKAGSSADKIIALEWLKDTAASEATKRISIDFEKIGFQKQLQNAEAAKVITALWSGATAKDFEKILEEQFWDKPAKTTESECAKENFSEEDFSESPIKGFRISKAKDLAYQWPHGDERSLAYTIGVSESENMQNNPKYNTHVSCSLSIYILYRSDLMFDINYRSKPGVRIRSSLYFQSKNSKNKIEFGPQDDRCHDFFDKCSVESANPSLERWDINFGANNLKAALMEKAKQIQKNGQEDVIASVDFSSYMKEHYTAMKSGNVAWLKNNKSQLGLSEEQCTEKLAKELRKYATKKLNEWSS